MPILLSGFTRGDVLLRFATNVRKKREAESGAYLTPPKQNSLHFLGFLWPNSDISTGYTESK